MQTADGSVWSIRTEGICQVVDKVSKLFMLPSGNSKNSTGKMKKSCTFVLPNSDPCVHKEVRVKLSVGRGLK